MKKTIRSFYSTRILKFILTFKAHKIQSFKEYFQQINWKFFEFNTKYSR